MIKVSSKIGLDPKRSKWRLTKFKRLPCQSFFKKLLQCFRHIWSINKVCMLVISKNQRSPSVFGGC